MVLLMTSRSSMQTKPEKIYSIGGKKFTVSDVCDKYRELHGSEIKRTAVHNRLGKGWTFDELVQKKHTGYIRNTGIYTTNHAKSLAEEKDERNDFLKIFNKGFR